MIEHFLDAGDGGSGVPARGKEQAAAASGAREPRGARERLSPAFVIDEQALGLRELAEHEQRLDGVGHETHHARLTDAGSVELGSQRQEPPDGPAGVPLRKLEEAERGDAEHPTEGRSGRFRQGQPFLGRPACRRWAPEVRIHQGPATSERGLLSGLSRLERDLVPLSGPPPGSTPIARAELDDAEIAQDQR